MVSLVVATPLVQHQLPTEGIFSGGGGWGQWPLPQRSLKAHLQPTGIACRGTIFIYENPAKAEIHPIKHLREMKEGSVCDEEPFRESLFFLMLFCSGTHHVLKGFWSDSPFVSTKGSIALAQKPFLPLHPLNLYTVKNLAGEMSD